MKHFIFICLSVLVITACNNRRDHSTANSVNEQNETALEETADIIDRSFPGGEIDSLGYYGVYEGANWQGAETHKAKLILYNNNRYMIESVDLGNNTRTEEEHGTYLIFGDLLTLTPDDNATPRYYNNLEDELTEVDENQQKVVPSYHSTNFRMIRK